MEHLAWWLLALSAMSVAAYLVHALDFLGAVASFFLGLIVLLLGGSGWLLLLVLFTGLGFAATRIGYARKKAMRIAEGVRGERSVSNVMGNGAAAAFVALATQLPQAPVLAVALAYATAVAAVAADTLAAELGALARRARLIVPPFPVVRAGTDGGVSWLGQACALLASLAIAMAAVWLLPIPLRLAWVPALAGWLGCQLDSILGATLEGAPPDKPLSKQDVNFLASALVAFSVLLGGAFLL